LSIIIYTRNKINKQKKHSILNKFLNLFKKPTKKQICIHDWEVVETGYLKKYIIAAISKNLAELFSVYEKNNFTKLEWEFENKNMLLRGYVTKSILNTFDLYDGSNYFFSRGQYISTTNFQFTNQTCSKNFQIVVDLEELNIYIDDVKNKVCLLCGKQDLLIDKFKQIIDKSIKEQITEILKTLDKEKEAYKKEKSERIKEQFIKDERQKLAQALVNNKEKFKNEKNEI
jgi:hypothetical protein